MKVKIENPKLTAKNPHFGNKYAPLDEVLRVVEPVIEAGYDIRQTSESTDGTVFFVTELLNANGQVVRRASFPFPTAGKAQEMGSTLTYCRRYGLLLMFNLVGEEDDDGNAAQGNKAKSKPARKAAPKKTKTTKTSAAADNDEEDW